jgi:hypothetical protein
MGHALRTRGAASFSTVVGEAVPSKGKTMAINEEQARALMLALLEAGREPMWALMLVSAYHGPRGREVALSVIEEQATPCLD